MYMNEWIEWLYVEAETAALNDSTEPLITVLKGR